MVSFAEYAKSFEDEPVNLGNTCDYVIRGAVQTNRLGRYYGQRPRKEVICVDQ